ncbi:ribosome biogenesis protein [Candidatus Woesearchaeota archaeon]|nr:ribosome biogenesis protein [Candidatus Woesearchaeota archaeon]
MRHIYKCTNCNNYTMKEICSCGNKSLHIGALKYKPNDRIASYRRKAKQSEYVKRSLI